MSQLLSKKRTLLERLKEVDVLHFLMKFLRLIAKELLDSVTIMYS